MIDYPPRFEFWYSHLQQKMAQLKKKLKLKNDMSCYCDVDYCCPLCSAIQLQAIEYADAKLHAHTNQRGIIKKIRDLWKSKGLYYCSYFILWTILLGWFVGLIYLLFWEILA